MQRVWISDVVWWVIAGGIGCGRIERREHVRGIGCE